MREKTINQIASSMNTKARILESEEILEQIIDASKEIVNCYKNSKKVLICGNGGSASDAQHMEGELIGRFLKERTPLSAIALTSNSTTVTAIGNDYGFDTIFSRQVEAYGSSGDVFIGITTSGNSENILSAMKWCKKQKIKTIALLGNDGGKAKDLADISIIVPSDETPRIQESHIMIIHIICDLVEGELFI